MSDHDNDWKRAHSELVRIAGERAALDHDEGRWLLVARSARVHERFGFATFTEYVERVLGYGPRVTEEKLRVAEALQRLPVLTAALAAGDLSWSAVRELTRVAVGETERDWLTAARSRTVREVERLVSGRRPGDTPGDPARPEARRHTLRFDVAAETLAIFREAMAKLRRDSAGPLDDDAALLLMARAVPGGPTDAGRANYQIAMTVCERCGAGTQQGKGEAIAVEAGIVEMAECDAQHLHEGERATQTIPPATRRAVMRRDGGRCQVPGCCNAVFVDIHHVRPRAAGGDHDPELLLVLCGAHHRALHRGRFTIEGRASTGFIFCHADGSPYGQMAARSPTDNAARALSALCGLGFTHGEAARAIASVHVGAGSSVEQYLRAAFAELPARALRVRDSARPGYTVGSVPDAAPNSDGGDGSLIPCRSEAVGRVPTRTAARRRLAPTVPGDDFRFALSVRAGALRRDTRSQVGDQPTVAGARRGVGGRVPTRAPQRCSRRHPHTGGSSGCSCILQNAPARDTWRRRVSATRERSRGEACGARTHTCCRAQAAPTAADSQLAAKSAILGAQAGSSPCKGVFTWRPGAHVKTS